ncbi:MAG: nitroreductase family protein [Muribaculaceae bacterium]|nr:nitroreductase family protein [Muribaculaceae bacterium]
MDSFRSLVLERYSCRNYDSARPVTPQLISDVLEDARLAPSACNRQPWEFWVILNDSKAREAVLASYGREWLATAPAFIICMGREEEGWVRPFDSHSHIDVDLSIAAEHICLSATEHGLGTCWVCNFDPDVLRRGLEIPAGLRPVAIIPIGYPAEGSKVPEKKRKAPEEIIRWFL